MEVFCFEYLYCFCIYSEFEMFNKLESIVQLDELRIFVLDCRISRLLELLVVGSEVRKNKIEGYIVMVKSKQLKKSDRYIFREIG